LIKGILKVAINACEAVSNAIAFPWRVEKFPVSQRAPISLNNDDFHPAGARYAITSSVDHLGAYLSSQDIIICV
jgi:hypothetical protein